MTEPNRNESIFESIARKSSKVTGSTGAFILAASIIIIWLATGPVFKFSDTWQLVINTGTTIITFLMVFLIQRSQNKDSMAVQLKLNELIAAHKGASNRLVDVEDLSEKELKILHEFYVNLALLSKSDKSLTRSHSIDEAQRRHKVKLEETGV